MNKGSVVSLSVKRLELRKEESIFNEVQPALYTLRSDEEFQIDLAGRQI